MLTEQCTPGIELNPVTVKQLVPTWGEKQQAVAPLSRSRLSQSRQVLMWLGHQKLLSR